MPSGSERVARLMRFRLQRFRRRGWVPTEPGRLRNLVQRRFVAEARGIAIRGACLGPASN